METVKTFGEIRQGDIVRRQLEGAQELVLSVRASGAHVCLKLSSIDGVERQYQAASDLPVILVYRPWPEGKTEQDMQDRINEAVRQATVHVGTDRPFLDASHLGYIRGAIEAYELGKPGEVKS